MYITTNGVTMTNKTTLPHYDYLDRLMHPFMDMTNLDRLPTDTLDPVLNAINVALNAQAEELELLFIEIECDRIDREEAEEDKPKKKASKKSKEKKALFEGLDDATREELLSEGFELE